MLHPWCLLLVQAYINHGKASAYALKEWYDKNICQALPYSLHWRQDHETGFHKRHHNPDVQAAERREDDPHNQGQGYGKDQGQEFVDHVLAELKESVAADPDFVEGVR